MANIFHYNELWKENIFHYNNDLQGVLFGDRKEVINGKFIEVKSFAYVMQEVFSPHNTDFIRGELSIYLNFHIATSDN